MARERNICAYSGGECLAPAGWGTSSGYASNNSSSANARCYACGESVCTADTCSKLVNYRGRRSRLCTNCQHEHREDIKA